jgi:pyrophosphatase PpaX
MMVVMVTVRAVIFDLDGTLADTFGLIVSSFNAACTPHTGRTYLPADVISRFGVPDSAMIRREVPQCWEEADEAYHVHYQSNHAMVQAFPGVAEMLEELHGRQMPMGLVTGKGRRTAEITLEALAWRDYFGAVVTGDDMTRQKPHPDGPLAAARTLGVEPRQCAMVGDSPSDIGAGKAAGMLTIAAGWHDVYHERLKKLEPHYWAKAPGAVLRLITESTP